MTELREHDAMICRSCGLEERASEGYPCKDCGTFICIMCVFKGVVRCERCASSAASANGIPGADPGSPRAANTGHEIDWPEH